jgi:hypothetical protein
MSAAAAAVSASSADFPLPATPWITSAPPEEPRAASSRAVMPARSASRPTST